MKIQHMVLTIMISAAMLLATEIKAQNTSDSVAIRDILREEVTS